MTNIVPATNIVDRDFRAYELRMMGLSYRAIARSMDIGEKAVRLAIQRASNKMQDHHANVNQGIVMDLDRLDRLMSNIWSLTMPHKVITPDGDEISLPPNMDAVDRVLKIMAHRAKLQGWDQVTLNVNQGSGELQQIQIGPGDKPVAQITAKDEAMKLIEIMSQAGALPEEAMQVLRQRILHEGEEGEDIVDAEVVEDDAPLELESTDDADDDESTFPTDEASLSDQEQL